METSSLGWPLVLVFALLVAGACSTTGVRPPAPTVNDIIELNSRGVPADEIVARVNQSGGVYWLTPSQLADLRKHDVPGTVIGPWRKRLRSTAHLTTARPARC